MSNNINNNHESVENIFNAFLMGGKTSKNCRYLYGTGKILLC